MEKKLIPCKYVIDDDTYNFFVSSRDKALQTWVVENSGHVLSKTTLDFIYEPMPSSRTDEFLQDTRFSNPNQAYEYYQKYINKFT